MSKKLPAGSHIPEGTTSNDSLATSSLLQSKLTRENLNEKQQKLTKQHLYWIIKDFREGSSMSAFQLIQLKKKKEYQIASKIFEQIRQNKRSAELLEKMEKSLRGENIQEITDDIRKALNSADTDHKESNDNNKAAA